MNNRQAGRRRGRGGQRPQGNPGRPESGNRIDNRARGNAAQLLEKYKNLARDAQMQGDRVNTEYYLQFADHYFRVLGESRARFEENNRRQRDDGSDEDDDNVEQEAEGRGRRDDRDDREPRASNEDRGDRAERSDRRRNGRASAHGAASGRNGEDEGEDRAERAAQSERGDDGEQAEEAAPRRRTRARRQPVAEEAGSEAGIDADRLPPALSANDGETPAPKPRRRRTVRTDTADEASVA